MQVMWIQPKKKGPGQILAELRRKYPTRLDLPSESEIRACISTLVAKEKKKKQQGQGAGVVQSRGIAEPFLSSVIAIVDEFPTIVPAAAWQKFLVRHPPTDDPTYPTVLQVKSKVSSLKAQRKKNPGDPKKLATIYLTYLHEYLLDSNNRYIERIRN